MTLKNHLLGTFGQEALTCVRHCNLVDFWLLTYDQLEGRYLVWLVTQEGVASVRWCRSCLRTFSLLCR